MAEGTGNPPPGISGVGWLQAAGGLIQMWGLMEQGKTARIRGEQARQAGEFAAWQAERQGATAIAIGQRQAIEENRQATLVASRALAVAAASGGGVSDPTMVRMISSARGEGAYRANVALYEGEAKARQMKFEAITGRTAGYNAESEGYAAQQGYNLAALGSGAKTVASLYAKYGKNGPDTKPAGAGDYALIDS